MLFCCLQLSNPRATKHLTLKAGMVGAVARMAKGVPRACMPQISVPSCLPALVSAVTQNWRIFPIFPGVSMLRSLHAVGRFLPPDTPESGGCWGWEGAGVARDGRGTVLALQRGAMLTAAPLPAVHLPQALGFSQALLQEWSSRRPLPPTSGNHEWSNGAGDGNLSLAPLAHLSQPCTQPRGCTKPPADLGTLPLVGGTPGLPYLGRICHPAGCGQERQERE